MKGKRALICDELGPAELEELSRERLGSVQFGPVRLEDSFFTVPYSRWNPSEDPQKVAERCQLLILELDTPQPFVQVRVEESRWFAIGLWQGRAVAAIDGRTPGGELRGATMDEVRIYALHPKRVVYCIERPIQVAKSWSQVPFLIQGLQLPIRELDPRLTSSLRELMRARSRLLPGESVTREDFQRVTEMLRPLVNAGALGRPIDRTLLSRLSVKDDFQEMGALQPLQMLWLHPKWRPGARLRLGGSGSRVAPRRRLRVPHHGQRFGPRTSRKGSMAFTPCPWASACPRISS